MNEPRTAVFVSDVHLQGIDDPRTAPFAEFLRSWKGRVDAMFVVGDLFDFFWGFRGVVYWQHLPALAAFDELARSGMRLAYVEGNHEFRIAEAFRGAFRFETFVGEGEVRVAGKRILLCHGDLADPADHGYRLLHRLLRNPVTTAIGSVVPPSWAMAVARLASDTSRAYRPGRGQRLNELFRARARRAFADGFDAAIFGHSHEPALETLDHEGRRGTFANCGDWVENFTHLLFDGERFHLRRSDRPTGAIAVQS